MSQYDIEVTPLNTKLDTSKLHKLGAVAKLTF